MKRKIISLAMALFFFGLACTAFAQGPDPSIEFADIPGNGDGIKPFKLGKTEVTNQQYVNFLNAALRKNKITVGPVEPLDARQAKAKALAAYSSRNQQLIYDKNGNWMMDLLGVRVTGDHGRDGKFDLWEMENPLNRCMIEYDSEKKRFRVVDPEKVNWDIYFDNANLPDGVTPVDAITDWCELHEFWPDGVELEGRQIVSFSRDEVYDGDGNIKDNITFAGHLDLDCKLPSLEEVKRWPVFHVFYYGAKAFADFLGYDLPTLKELQWVMEGGKGYEYGTNDGTISIDNVVYRGRKRDPNAAQKSFERGQQLDGKHKGHPQPVASFPPNPYGVYNLAGNVVEWTKTKDNDHDLGCRQATRHLPGQEAFVRIGGAWPRPESSCRINACINTSVNIGNDHFGFRVVKRTN